MMTRYRRLTLGAVLCLALPALASAAGVQAPDGIRGLWSREIGDQSCIGERSGVAPFCWPSEVGVLTDLRETERGWVAAGQTRGSAGDGLFLLRQRGEGAESLLAPAVAGPRGRPELVVDDGILVGLVWLEGRAQSELVLRAAEWRGESWGETMTLPRYGSGSQLAPTATVLDDGRWLVLWTAFDGEDDETVWSVFDRGRWSAPRLVHEDNATPDILPAVIATPRGAIAAWSWLDGRDYRVRTAFYDGAAWHLGPVAAGRGALDARLVDIAGTYLLAFETVVPEASVALELDADGRALHRTSVAQRPGTAPVVDFAGSGVVFRWPESDAPAELVAPWEVEP